MKSSATPRCPSISAQACGSALVGNKWVKAVCGGATLRGCFFDAHRPVASGATARDSGPKFYTKEYSECQGASPPRDSGVIPLAVRSGARFERRGGRGPAWL